MLAPCYLDKREDSCDNNSVAKSASVDIDSPGAGMSIPRTYPNEVFSTPRLNVRRLMSKAGLSTRLFPSTILKSLQPLLYLLHDFAQLDHFSRAHIALERLKQRRHSRIVIVHQSRHVILV